jgi:hypothetical protein
LGGTQQQKDTGAGPGSPHRRECLFLPERARCIFLRERASSRTGVVAVLTLITAACHLLAAIGNITDFGTNQQEVLIAAVLIWALVAWVGALRAGRGHERPRRLSTLGWTMTLLLFAGQNVIVAGLAHLPSRDWD